MEHETYIKGPKNQKKEFPNEKVYSKDPNDVKKLARLLKKALVEESYPSQGINIKALLSFEENQYSSTIKTKIKNLIRNLKNSEEVKFNF